MTLYAQVSRMRVVSSTSVVECADQIVKKIIATYLEPNKTFPELRKMATSGLIDPLREFSEAARAESERLNFGPPEWLPATIMEVWLHPVRAPLNVGAGVLPSLSLAWP
jgi:hypothetical protein